MSKARIQGRVDMDASSVGTALGKASAAAAAFGAKMRGIGKGLSGFFTLGALSIGAKALISSADAAQDAAEAYGMSTDALQALQGMARTTKGGIEGLDGITKKLVESQARALEGSETELAAFENLGVASEDLTLSTDKLIKKIADGYAKTGNLSAVMSLLGKQTVGTSAFLKELANTGLQEAIDKQKELGESMQTDVIDKLAILDDKLASTGQRIKAGFANFVLPKAEFASGVIGGLLEGRSFSEAAALSREVMKEDEAARAQKRKEEQQAREGLLQASRVSGAEGKMRELEAIISKAGPSVGLGSELVRMGARGGIGGQEDKAVKLAREQLAALKEVASNTEGIDKIQTGILIP